MRTLEDGTTGDGRSVNHRGNWSKTEDGKHGSESPTRGESPRRRKQEKWNDGEGREKREERTQVAPHVETAAKHRTLGWLEKTVERFYTKLCTGPGMGQT